MRFRRNSVRTQGWCEPKNFEKDFKFKLTQNHKHKNILNIQISLVSNSLEKIDISFLTFNLHQFLHFSFQALISHTSSFLVIFAWIMHSQTLNFASQRLFAFQLKVSKFKDGIR